jgi:glycosyltransferase involved in cell wall biosynthesis
MHGLKYISWHDTSGYATAARRYLAGLIAAEVPLSWTPMVPGRQWGKAFHYQSFEGRFLGDPLLDPYCNAALDYDTVLVHLVPEYYPAWIAREPGRRMIGYTTWETDTLPAHWPALLNQMDEIWVPSRWNRAVFQGSGVRVPVRVVPHILPEAPLDERRPYFPPTYRVLNAVSDSQFVFYTVGVWSMRKALGKLLAAYWNAFSADESVTLIIKTSRQDMTHPWANRGAPLGWLGSARRCFNRLARQRPRKPASVLIAEENTPQAVIDALHTRGDAYVSLTRSEGWGLGPFDAVAAGNPVVITGYGGQRDFLSAEYACLVDYRLVPVSDPRNRDSYAPDQHWAEPDIAQASALMRSLYENPEEAKERGRQLRAFARLHFSRDAIMPIILDHLHFIP